MSPNKRKIASLAEVEFFPVDCPDRYKNQVDLPKILIYILSKRAIMWAQKLPKDRPGETNKTSWTSIRPKRMKPFTSER